MTPLALTVGVPPAHENELAQQFSERSVPPPTLMKLLICCDTAFLWLNAVRLPPSPQCAQSVVPSPARSFVPQPPCTRLPVSTPLAPSGCSAGSSLPISDAPAPQPTKPRYNAAISAALRFERFIRALPFRTRTDAKRAASQGVCRARKRSNLREARADGEPAVRQDRTTDR